MTEDKQGNVIYSRTTNTVQYVILKRQPDSIKFARVVRALELYTAQLPLLQSSDSAVRREWCELGTSLLEAAGQWLRDYYLAKQARAEAEIQLESARRLSEKIATALIVMPEANEERFWDAVGGFGVFWCEAPEEGIALYEKLFRLRHFGSVRKHVTGCYRVFCNKLLLPVLAAWHEEDNNHIARLWHDLVEEMCMSTNSELRGNGYFFVCAGADKAQTFIKAYHISSTSFYGDDRGMVNDLQDLYDNRIHDFSTEQINLAWQALPDSKIEHQTKELYFKPATKPATDVVAKSKTQPTNLLEVTSIRIENYTGDNSSGPRPGLLASLCYREGYLWAETDFEWNAVYLTNGYETELVGQRVFFQVNLNTLQSKAIAVNLYHPQYGDSFAGPFRTFEVYSNNLYISSNDGIKRYSLARKTWENLPVPVGGYARITALDGRIFSTSESAIIEMSPDGQTSRSPRKQPPSSGENHS